MEVITIQSEAFKVILEKMDRIDKKLDSNLKTPTLKDPWYDTQEACFILKVSKRTILTYRNQGKLPYSKIDGKIYFKEADIQKLLENHYKKLRR